MSKADLKKIEVKVALAEKYERLASVAGSKPKRRHFIFHANHFRNQVKAMKDKLGVEQFAEREILLDRLQDLLVTSKKETVDQ